MARFEKTCLQAELTNFRCFARSAHRFGEFCQQCRVSLRCARILLCPRAHTPLVIARVQASRAATRFSHVFQCFTWCRIPLVKDCVGAGGLAQLCMMRAKCAKCAKESPSRKKLFTHLREAHELPGFQRRGRFSREMRQMSRAYLHVEPSRAQPRRQHLPYRMLNASVPPAMAPAPARSTSVPASCQAAPATTAPSVAIRAVPLAHQLSRQRPL
mmetsp:Transcript_47990/g.102513  ORF Transcript_47990/g.102513 Transcript_47990/m.102513 type:complete len:214 (+) Transcript_47990:264-905(+)